MKTEEFIEGLPRFQQVLVVTGFTFLNRRTNLYQALLLQSMVEIDYFQQKMGINRSERWLHRMSKPIAMLEVLLFIYVLLGSDLIYRSIRKQIFKTGFYKELRRQGYKI